MMAWRSPVKSSARSDDDLADDLAHENFGSARGSPPGLAAGLHRPRSVAGRSEAGRRLTHIFRRIPRPATVLSFGRERCPQQGPPEDAE